MAKQRLFILSPDVVFAARVNMATVEYPLTEIDFDTVTVGAFGDVKAGMTLLVGSTAGADDLGRQRIRLNAISGTLYIGRSSQGNKDGEVDVADDMYLTVLDDDRVWAKIPYINDSGVSFKDEIPYTDQTLAPPPKANIEGGSRAATIDSVTELATFQFVGSGSYAVASGATLTTYTWDVGDGTITAGTGTNTITATFPAGHRYVRLTVTDSNGKTHSMRVLVYARDPAADTTIAFQCVEHRVTQQGQFCSFTILEDLDIADYPDGTAVIFWEGEPASASDYSNVKFWGWHQTDDNSLRAEKTGTLKDTTLHCLDVAGRLDTLPAFTQSVERNTAPSSWLEMAGLNMDLYIDYLLRWHSTALENTYFTPTGTGSNFPMVIIGSDGESLFDQAARRTKALVPDYILTCDRHGALRAIVDPMLQDLGDRTSTGQAALTVSNLTGISWQRHRPPTVHWIWGEAIVASTSEITAVFCTAPGRTPGQGLSENTSGEQLTQTQTALNICEGHRIARANAVNSYITLSLTADSGIEPADMTWVTLTAGDAYTRRQIGFATARCQPIELNISYENARTGTVTRVELTVEEETVGTPAVTYEQPEGPPLPDWIPPPTPAPTPTPTQGDGFGTLYGLVNAALGRTRLFSAASPTYSDIKPAGGIDYYDFILDPYDPSGSGYLYSSAGVYKSTDLDQVSPSWSLVLTVAAMNTATGGTLGGGGKLVGSINQSGYVALFHWASNGTLWCSFSENGGTSWSHNQINLGISSYGSAAGDIVDRVIGGSLRLYTAHNTESGRKAGVSNDKGDTWTVKDIASDLSSTARVVHVPYNDNTAGNIVYVSLGAGGTWRTVDGGNNWTELSETTDAKDGIGTYTQDRQRVYIFPSGGGFKVSTDGGDNWITKSATGLSGNVRAAGGFPYEGSQFYALTTAGVFVTIDGGDNWINKTGDWAFGFVVTTGGGTIVPDWTE